MNILILKQIIRESMFAHNKLIGTQYFEDSTQEKKIELIIKVSEKLTDLGEKGEKD